MSAQIMHYSVQPLAKATRTVCGLDVTQPRDGNEYTCSRRFFNGATSDFCEACRAWCVDHPDEALEKARSDAADLIDRLREEQDDLSRDRPHSNVVDSDATKTRGEAASAVMVLSAGLPRTDPADVEQVAASRAAREMWMTLCSAAPILSSTLERWTASLRGTVTAEEAGLVMPHGGPKGASS